jgi:uncharacterized protein (TIGR03086 family)
MMGDDMRNLYQRAVESFGARVHAVGDDQWHLPTPCTEWDVHALINHLVYEMRWSVPLFAGGTIAEVGDRFEGDLLGDDPKGAWNAAAEQAVTAVRDDGVMERTVHLSFGDVPGREYAQQLHADLLIHGWDLARAIGGDERLDSELVHACATWFKEREELYRGSGAVGPRTELSADADAQTELLAAFGRRA